MIWSVGTNYLQWRVEFIRSLYFPHSDWTRTEYLSVFSPNAGKYGPEKTPIWRLFTRYDEDEYHSDCETD